MRFCAFLSLLNLVTMANVAYFSALYRKDEDAAFYSDVLDSGDISTILKACLINSVFLLPCFSEVLTSLCADSLEVNMENEYVVRSRRKCMKTTMTTFALLSTIGMPVWSCI
jgi:hypothetical protein